MYTSFRWKYHHHILTKLKNAITIWKPKLKLEFLMKINIEFEWRLSEYLDTKCILLQENLSISSDAPQTLRNFCVWQQDQNPKEDDHPHHYDTAVLITK